MKAENKEMMFLEEVWKDGGEETMNLQAAAKKKATISLVSRSQSCNMETISFGI